MTKLKAKDLSKIKNDIINHKLATRKNKKVNIIIHMGTCGVASGAQKILDILIEKISKSKIKKEILISKSACIGFCGKEPLITIEISGQEPVIYQELNREKILKIFDKHILKGEPISDYALARGNQQQIAKILELKKNRIPSIEEISFYKHQELRVLRNRGLIDPENITDYISRDGYQGMAKALAFMRPDEIINELINSGLRGRGGAGFPTGLKWQFAAKENSDTKYVICNADEGDPGAYMDRSILEGDPHSVIEGMVIAGKAIGAHQGYVYCRAEYPLAIKMLHKAIIQAEEQGFLGNNILETGFDFDLKIYRGAGAFVCGEETALMRSIEGERGVPRPRPPFPAQAGLWEKPTILNNVETLANIAQIILNGSAWFASIGTEKSKGTKVFALTGDVNNVGLIEVPIGTTLRTIVFDIGGGVLDGKDFKAAQIGGPSGGCISSQHLDIPIDYETINKLGAIMGSGGLIVMNEDKSAVDIARFFMDFCQKESCGKCTPCGEGTKRMLEILNNICKRKGKLGDIEFLEEMGKIIKGTSLCGLGQTAPNPALSTIRYFRKEYENNIRDKMKK